MLTLTNDSVVDALKLASARGYNPYDNTDALADAARKIAATAERERNSRNDSVVFTFA